MYQQSIRDDVTKWKNNSDFGNLTDIDQIPKKDLWYYLGINSDGHDKMHFRKMIIESN